MSVAEVTTPTVRTAARRAWFWVAAIVVILVVTAGVLVVQRAADRGGYLDPASPTPDGSLAVAEVLRAQGVDVIPSTSLDATAAAVRDAESTTVLLADLMGVLAEDQLDRLAALGARLVIVEPGFVATEALAPGLSDPAAVDGGFTADCALPAVRNAGEVDGSGTGYLLPEDGDATGCLAGDDRFALVVLGDADVTVLGLGEVLTNRQIDDAGNAALALTLLGERETLVWYTPGAEDFADAGGPPSLAELTAPWLTPVVLLALLVAVATAFWRGRRMGALVVERLPVVVRASETMEGRARLYARTGARDHALHGLRVGTVARLARACGLPRTASVDEVISAVAHLLDRPEAELRRLLVEDRPENDGQLVALSDRLLLLERDVDSAARP